MRVRYPGPCTSTTVNPTCHEATMCLCPDMIVCDICGGTHMSDGPCFLCKCCGDAPVDIPGTYYPGHQPKA